ncbi:MAG: hypothetical protein K2X48_04050 [Chitinophagaceae bacterium]|nr:hypothetical protein [Chitinophagaceae bacterium]
MIFRNFVEIHNQYRKSVHALNDDLRFWAHFINNWAIPEYKRLNVPMIIYESAYSTYDSSIETSSDLLKFHSEGREIHSDDLEIHSKDFFNWLMNLSIVRAYNSLEILMLQVIDVIFLGSNFNSVLGKQDINRINNSVIEHLITPSDRINNKHLVNYLCENSPSFNQWIQAELRIDCSTTWHEYFYLMSVLRHIVTHQAMVLNKNLLNEIKSKYCKDVFERYFKVNEIHKNMYELKPNQDNFLSLLDFSMQFAANTLKFIAKEPNFDFLDMK